MQAILSCLIYMGYLFLGGQHNEKSSISFLLFCFICERCCNACYFVGVIMIVKPGFVYPSGRPATRTNDDCDVGRLLSRESRELLKSNESNALSTFFVRRNYE